MKAVSHKIERALRDKALINSLLGKDQIKGVAPVPFVKTSESIKRFSVNYFSRTNWQSKSMANCIGS